VTGCDHKEAANAKNKSRWVQRPRPTRVPQSCNARSSRTDHGKRSRVCFRLALGVALRHAASLMPFRRPPALTAANSRPKPGIIINSCRLSDRKTTGVEKNVAYRNSPQFNLPIIFRPALQSTINNRPIIVRPNPVIVRFAVRASGANRQAMSDGYPESSDSTSRRRTANRNVQSVTGRNDQSAAHPLCAVRVICCSIICRRSSCQVVSPHAGLLHR